ncbi:hypothetical protein ACOMHN_013840 [Nucella lapillus]
MALMFDESPISTYLYEEKSEKMHNSPNIDLDLECEDDQSYFLPQSTNVSNGVQIHASSNVSMRISFSPSVPQNLTCRYCQCNFLSESHFLEHMYFHNDINESGEEDGDENAETFQVASEGSVVDNDSADSGYIGLFNMKKASPKEERDGTVVKTEATVPGLGKATLTAVAIGMATATVPSQVKAFSCFPPRLPQMSPTVPENKAAEPKSVRRKSVTSEINSSPPQTTEEEAAEPKSIKPEPVSNEMNSSPCSATESAAAEPKSLKRKSVSNEAVPNPPRLTMTIKKSKSSYEIQREENSQDSVAPGLQKGEESCDVQSDSANETIDVESSSPNSSPNSVKDDAPAVISGRKKTEVKYTCTECDKDYVSKYALKRHTATHSDERPFLCNFPGCIGAFKLKSRLSDHIRYVHKQKTPRTKNRRKPVPNTATSSLAQVLLSPAPVSPAPLSGGKPSAKTKQFKCPVNNCNREFRDSFNLASHVCLHTGHMPYMCSQPECTFTTIQKTSFDWHMQKMHSQS